MWGGPHHAEQYRQKDQGVEQAKQDHQEEDLD
jgi:hypothetical protein